MPHLSSAQRAGNLLFISGQLGFDEHRKLLSGCSAQTERCLVSLGTILKQYDAEVSSIVKITSWLTDRSLFAEYDRAMADFFGEHKPARSTVFCDLALPDALVEIEAIALLSGGS
jgi:2-iminobutanoate/2-iminopropanoate deaminase